MQNAVDRCFFLVSSCFQGFAMHKLLFHNELLATRALEVGMHDAVDSNFFINKLWHVPRFIRHLGLPYTQCWADRCCLQLAICFMMEFVICNIVWMP